MKRTNTSPKELNLISQFLEITSQTVTSGRGRQELTDQERSLIEKLARNEATKAERRILVLLLSNNEAAMEYLTSLTKDQS